MAASSLKRPLFGSVQHLGARTHQEDSFAFSSRLDDEFVHHGGIVAVVADGMGGGDYGSEVSQLAVRRFISAYEEKRDLEPIREAMHRAVQAANRAVVDLAKSRGPGIDTGTTLAAVVLSGGKIYWLSIGDSRIYRVSQDEIRQLSTDHNIGEVLDDMARRSQITSAEAHRDPQRNALTSYLGAPQIGAIGFGAEAEPLLPNEVILLCSDGLYRAVSEKLMQASCTGDPQQLCDSVVQSAVTHMMPEQDNITAISIGFSPSAAAAGPATAAKFLDKEFWRQNPKLLLITVGVITILLLMLAAL